MSDPDPTAPIDFGKPLEFRVRDDIEERMRRLERLGLGPKAEDFIDHGTIEKPIVITITKPLQKGGGDGPDEGGVPR
jgi:hypothetical protein